MALDVPTADAPVAEPPAGPDALGDMLAEHVRPVSMPLVDRVASAVVTAAPPILVLLGMWLGWSHGLLAWQDLLVLAIFYVVIGSGITVGFHRLLTHRSFKSSRLLRAGFAALGSAAAEGPVIDWVATHRKHHQFSDEDGDPHSPHVDDRHGWRGELWRLLARAHRLGVLRHGGRRRAALREGPARRPVDPVRRPDVRAVGGRRARGRVRARGRADRHGHRRADGAAVGRRGADLLPAPRDLQHQLASATSSAGATTTRGDESRNVFWLAIPTWGESWHNNHHAFPTSYRHGLRRWQLDPSAGIIRLMEMTGLAWDVVRVDPTRRERKLHRVSLRFGLRPYGTAPPRARSRPAAAPVRGRFWDGTVVGATEADAPIFTIRSPEAIAHCPARPGRAGSRACVRARADRRRRHRQGAADRRHVRGAEAVAGADRQARRRGDRAPAGWLGRRGRRRPSCG